MFAEAFHSMIKGIHLALNVKTFFRNSTLVTGSSMESSSQKPGVPTDSHHRHRQKREREREEETYLQETTIAKLKRLCLGRLIHSDQETTTRHAMALRKAKGLINLLAPIKYY
jgi:hypothetical protein